MPPPTALEVRLRDMSEESEFHYEQALEALRQLNMRPPVGWQDPFRQQIEEQMLAHGRRFLSLLSGEFGATAMQYRDWIRQIATQVAETTILRTILSERRQVLEELIHKYGWAAPAA